MNTLKIIFETMVVCGILIPVATVIGITLHKLITPNDETLVKHRKGKTRWKQQKTTSKK